MSDGAQLRDALVTIRRLNERVAELEDRRREPIAVVGLGCRFPGGGDGPVAFWRLLLDGVDAVGPVPAERWDAGALFADDVDAPGTVATRFGAFLDGIDLFDAAAFGIAPREAERMDPQQRLLLEVAFETFEDAGVPLEQAQSLSTGVFLGLHSHSTDYSALQLARPDAVDAYTATGTALSIAANRLSYAFGLRGPSLVLDTACSSSLVAVHLACGSLRSGESDLALAGGANLVLTPESTIAFSRMRMLAADGRCKTFDARADGFGRGDGCGLVALKRLSDAVRDGDRVRAVIRGSAVNQDGRTNGLTAPSGLAQREVVRAALASAGVEPARVGYVETHGTGTQLGDPIEVEALVDVLGERPADARLLLGAVKTNLGHLEGAAGVAGLIKAVLALEHGVVPPNLHFTELNPHISFGGAPIAVPTGPEPWTGDGRVAGVSSFGWGGTNAHVVVAEAPPLPAAGDAPAREGALVLPVSARSADALRELAAAYRSRVADAGVSVAALCAAAAVRRTHHEHRLAVAGRSADDLVAGLEAFLAGETAAGLAHGEAPEEAPGVVLVFSGHGPSAAGMGRRLLAEEPVFRATVERVDAAHRALAGWSVLEELAADPARSRLARPEVAQPALLALQLGLAELWQSWGVVPDAVVGHSAGEIAAAHVAGALSLEDAVRVAFQRGRVIAEAGGAGRMAAVALPAAEVERLLAGVGGAWVAAVNGPAASVVAGEPEAVERVVRDVVADGAFARLLEVEYASHGPAMELAAGELAAALAGLEPAEPRLPVLSTVRGGPATTGDFGAEYWRRNLREPVLFAAAVEALCADGHSCFVEVGPHPALTGAVAATLDARGERGTVVPSLRRGQDDSATMAAALAALHVAGVEVDWRGVYPQAPPVPLPRYPFQRRRYWLDAVPSPRHAARRERWRDWIYELAWEPRPPTPSLPPAGEEVAVVGDGHGLGDALAGLLGVEGARARSTGEGDPLPATVVHVGALDAAVAAGADARAVEEQVERLLREVQALAGRLAPAGARRRLVIVTRGACALPDDAPDAGATGPVGAALGGLVRVVPIEHPHVECTLVDLAPAGGTLEAEAEAVVAELAGTGEHEVALRPDGRRVARLVPAEVAPAAPVRWRADASYLVTGGLGELGLALSRHAVARGARHLVLVGRRPLPDRAGWPLEPTHPDAGRVDAILALERAGATVRTEVADVADEHALADVFARVHASGPPLRGIVHAAVDEVRVRPLAELEPDELRAMLHAKVAGAWNLDRLASKLELDFLALFSSTAAVVPADGLAHYAAANAFLDRLAHRRRALGLPALAVDWGLWEAADAVPEEAHERMLRTGFRAMPVADALEALDALLGSDAAQRLVADVDWTTARPVYEARGPRPLLERLGAAADVPRAVPSALAAELDALPVSQRRERLRGLVHAEVSAVLGLEPAAVALDAGFFRLGMDSFTSVELRSRLGRRLGTTLPSTVAFTYPTVDALAGYLDELVGNGSVAPAEEPAADERGPELSALSEEDLVALLADRLERIGGDEAGG